MNEDLEDNNWGFASSKYENTLEIEDAAQEEFRTQQYIVELDEHILREHFLESVY